MPQGDNLYPEALVVFKPVLLDICVSKKREAIIPRDNALPEIKPKCVGCKVEILSRQASVSLFT